MLRIHTARDRRLRCNFLRYGLRLAAAAATLLLVTAPAAVAQDLIADTVSIRVIAQDSTPIPYAHLGLKDNQGHEQDAVTDSFGKCLFVTQNGAGIYELHIRAFGYAPLSVIVQRTGQNQRIERTILLDAISVALPAVKVAALKPRKIPTPGDRGEQWNSLASERLPVDPGSLEDVAALEPGVVRASTGGLSVGGQAPDQNRTSVDGASYGGNSLPSEGVRSAGIITNTYDPARGQFTGGEIAATTISGTNIWGGALTTAVTDPSLQYGGSQGNARDLRTRNLRVSGGGGGDLIHDRLFVYGSVDATSGQSHGGNLAVRDPASLGPVGISPDSVSRFLAIAQQLGLYAPTALVASGTKQDAVSALTRIDYALTEKQSLTLRLDWRGTDVRNGPPPLSIASGDKEHSTDGGVFGELTSAIGKSTNEFRMYHSSGGSHANALYLPSGNVEVLSSISDQLRGASSLSFGNGSYSPREMRSLTEAADEITRRTDNGAHLFKAGFLLQDQRSSTRGNDDPFGTFSFENLGALENGTPASFTRQLSDASGESVRRYAGLYAGDVWHAQDNLQIAIGVRVDGNEYGRRPAPSAAVAALSGKASTQLPSEVFAMPRVGFRYDIPSTGSWTIDGGAGAFSGTVNLASLASVWNQAGLLGTSITCIGSAAPVPAWNDYLADPSTIPSACSGGASQFSSSVPSATLFARDFGAPRTWRANIEASGNLTSTWGTGLSALVVHGTHMATALDRNLTRAPQFTLPDENGRPVYASSADVDPSTGGLALTGSRVDPALGVVSELASNGESWAEQLIGTVSGRALHTSGALSYAYTRSSIRGTGEPGIGLSSATTAGNPATMEWTDAPFVPRHTFQFMTQTNLGRRWNVSTITRISSGLPFTPMVAGDINGDGFANDRAFVFDPATTTSPSIAQGITQLLDAAPGSIRDCLEDQLGSIARPGSCNTGWSPSLDVSATMLALGTVNSRRFTLTLRATNVTAGLDYLLHGPNNLHGWGQFPFPDRALLLVRGFDAQRKAFLYNVNPQFGQTSPGSVQRVPLMISLQGRITFGDDPRYQQLASAIQAGLGTSRESIRKSVAGRIRNIPAITLQLAAADSAGLALSLSQRARLQQQADSLAPEIDDVVDALSTSLAERGPLTPARKARIEELARRGLSLVDGAIAGVQKILTPDQWTRLPSWLRKGPSENELRNTHPTIQILGGGP